MNKQKVIEMYLECLDKKIKDIESALNSLHTGIDTAPGPSQSHSDTTRFQQSRIALETSNRLSSLKSTRAMTGLIYSERAVCLAVGALIAIQDVAFGDEEYYFIVPGKGGESLFLDDVEIVFVSFQAPILEAISNVKEGDLFEFRDRKLKLLSIS